MMRPAIQTGFAMVGFQPRPRRGFLARYVRQFFFNASGDYYWELHGVLETRQLRFSPLSFRTQSGETFGVSIESSRDVLPYDFEVGEGVILPAGPYDFTNLQLSVQSAGHRPVVADASYHFGQFYSGHYDDVRLGLTLKVKGYASLAFDANLVRGRMPQGNFSQNVYQLKADFFLSPDIGFMNYIQYDDISDSLGWNARLRWQITPGNEIYLVYNKNWLRSFDPVSRFLPMGERGVIKITLSIRP
jgi:hypothetical protein